MKCSMERCLLCVGLRCPVDLGTGHVVVCSRTMCRQCFTESKRVVQLDNERVLFGVRHVFLVAKGRYGMDRTLQAEVGSRTGMSSLDIIYFRAGKGSELRLRAAGWACNPREAGGALGIRNFAGFLPFLSCF